VIRKDRVTGTALSGDSTGWSDNQITFTIPSPSGSGGQWHVVPGSTATITVTTAQGTSNTATLTIGSS
jgi:hypothetical protein